jgi:hypothetical protein
MKLVLSKSEDSMEPEEFLDRVKAAVELAKKTNLPIWLLTAK